MTEYPKTYIRARNLTFVPDGPLRIGHVIEFPNKPTKPLLTLNPLPATVKSTWVSNEINRSSRNALNGKIWAKLFQGYQVDIGGEKSGDREAHYSADSIEIKYFKDDPTDEEGDKLRKDEPKVAEVWGKFPRRPVYIISGLMIAKNLKFETGEKEKAELHAGGAAEINEDVAIGGKGGGNQETEATDAYQVEGDIILAYQLHVVKRKEWYRSKAGVDVYDPDDGFLGTDSKEESEEKDEGAATAQANVDDLKESADLYEVEYDEPEELLIGDKRIAVIAFDDEEDDD